MESVHVDEEQPNVEDRRIILRIQSNCFIPSHSVASSITSIWKSQFTGEWDTWTSVPRNEKEIWFNAFKDKYKWDKRLNDKVWKLFNTVGSKSFRNYMSKARKTPTQKPEFMNLVAWQTLCRRWQLPEFISKSERMKVARQANKSLHIGGSISNVEHKRRLEKELGRVPIAGEVFLKTHRGLNGTFVDNHAQETWEQYNEKFGDEDSLDAESGNVSNTYSRWAEHVGVKNGRAYGSVLDEYMLQNVNMEESSVHNVPNNELDDLRETVMTQKLEQALLRTELENLSSTQEVQSRKLDNLVESQKSMEQSIRTTVADEMKKATRQILEILRGR